MVTKASIVAVLLGHAFWWEEQIQKKGRGRRIKKRVWKEEREGGQK